MKNSRILLLVLTVVIGQTSVSAVDLRPDDSFPQLFAPNEIVHDGFIQPDGKIVLAGRRLTNGSGNADPFMRRFNPDGTLDPTFNATQILPASGGFGYVSEIFPMANGQFAVAGYFHVGTTFARYARLNSDGSVDPTLALGTFFPFATQPDGKLLFCAPRVFNGQTYRIGHRINFDGTFDASFRITFADGGNCNDAEVLPDGKILMPGTFTVGGQQIKSLHRLNPDGSRDASFEPDIGETFGNTVEGLTVLPDGKLLFRYQGASVRRLLPNGALDISISSCAGDIFLPLTDGNLFTTECRKWPTAQLRTEIVRMFPDGALDQSLDNLRFSGSDHPEVEGLLDAGNGNYFAYGHFWSVNSVQRPAFVRLVPDLTPPKASFDFDGDGRSDVAVYRPSNGVWYIKQSSEGPAYQQWGLPADRPVAADVDHDGKTDVGVFRNGQWHALSPILGHFYMCLGAAGDTLFTPNLDDFLPVRQDFAVRGLRGGAPRWFMWPGGFHNCWFSNQQPPAKTVAGELASDRPVVGDFNGDSREDIGYYRDGLWYSEDSTMDAGPKSFQWGVAGDIPVPGDYDGDRQTDYAIFRPSTNDWWINRTTDGIFVITFGQTGDVPVPADYDGDGKMDVAVFRNGVWWQYRMGTGTVNVENWGLTGDIPIPAQAQF